MRTACKVLDVHRPCGFWTLAGCGDWLCWHGKAVLVLAQVAALTKQLAAKGSEADSLSRRVGAVNNLTTAFEQVRKG
jgi:hypothetical protein